MNLVLNAINLYLMIAFVDTTTFVAAAIWAKTGFAPATMRTVTSVRNIGLKRSFAKGTYKPVSAYILAVSRKRQQAFGFGSIPDGQKTGNAAGSPPVSRSVITMKRSERLHDAAERASLFAFFAWGRMVALVQGVGYSKFKVARAVVTAVAVLVMYLFSPQQIAA